MVLAANLPPGFFPLYAADPMRAAIALAEAGAEPGTLPHGELISRSRFAVILAPDRPVDEPMMLNLAAQALHDALAALAPVGLPIEIAERRIRVNQGDVATIDIRRGPATIPDWVVLAFDVAVDLGDPEPGHNPDRTCTAEEGFTASASEILAATCRHLLGAIDAWNHPITEQAAA
jgi:hypothetical protein